MRKATINDASRKVYDAVCDRIRKDDEINDFVTVFYNGSDIKGILQIEGRAGYEKEFKKALKIFTDEYCG